MAGQPTPDARVGAAEAALRQVQGQVAALEELSEQLSLSVHVLESEVTALAEEVRSAPAQSGIAPAGATPSPVRRSDDLDGARLVALNMALEGETRQTVEKYLVDHFEIADRERLLDEVYAAMNA